MRNLIIIVLIVLQFSCDEKQDLKRYADPSSLVGKWYFTGVYSDIILVQDSSEFPNLYFQIAEVSPRSGKFTVDTYFNEQLIRHQLIIARESDISVATSNGITFIRYKDQNRGEFVRATDFGDQFQFAQDSPNYFFNYDFPTEDKGRNYFVRYTDKQ